VHHILAFLFRSYKIYSKLVDTRHSYYSKKKNEIQLLNRRCTIKTIGIFIKFNLEKPDIVQKLYVSLLVSL